MNTSTTAAGGVATNAPSVPIMRGVEYRCGDCGARNLIKGGDPVRCRQCGFRILYKTRTKRCKYFAITSAPEDGIVLAAMSTDLCSANYFLMGGGASVGDATVNWGVEKFGHIVKLVPGIMECRKYYGILTKIHPLFGDGST